MLATAIGNLLARLFPKRVSFDDGSYVEWLNREAILYAEPNGFQMDVPWLFQERRVKGRQLRLSHLAVWDRPHPGSAVSREKQAEIRRKIQEYSKERGIPLEVIEDVES